MSVQTSYDYTLDEGILGERATNGLSQEKTFSTLARGIVKAGYGVFKAAASAADRVTTNMLQAYHQPSPGPSVDVDAFLTTTATSGSAVTAGTLTSGVAAGAVIQPPRRITVTTSSHANWNATTMTITFPNEAGISVTETLNIADAGGETLTTTARASGAPTAYTMQAQGGTGGSYTIGIEALPSLTISDFLGIAMRDAYKETLSSSRLWNLTGQNSSTTGDYIDNESMSVLAKGCIWGYAEEAVTDMDPVYVRVAANGGNTVLGAFRNDSDSGNCVAVTGARFARKTSAAGPAMIDLNVGW